jgi:hypothetical protein
MNRRYAIHSVELANAATFSPSVASRASRSALRCSGVLLFVRVMSASPLDRLAGSVPNREAPAFFLPHLARSSRGRNRRAEGKGRRSRSRVTRGEAERPCAQPVPAHTRTPGGGGCGSAGSACEAGRARYGAQRLVASPASALRCAAASLTDDRAHCGSRGSLGCCRQGAEDLAALNRPQWTASRHPAGRALTGAATPSIQAPALPTLVRSLDSSGMHWRSRSIRTGT